MRKFADVIRFVFKEKKTLMFTGTFRCVMNNLIISKAKKNFVSMFSLLGKRILLCIKIFRYVTEKNKQTTKDLF